MEKNFLSLFELEMLFNDMKLQTLQTSIRLKCFPAEIYLGNYLQ